jgi:hypothetical protein
MVGPAPVCDTAAMEDYEVDPADEARHEPEAEQFWNESYYFDFHDDEGTLGGYVRIGLYPNLGVTWYWACLVGADRPLVTVIDQAAPVPRSPSLDLAGKEFSANHSCEDPIRRFRVGVEANALVFDDPAAVYGPLAGRRTPLTFDLTWEIDGPGGYQFSQLTRYEIPCDVRGRIRVGDESIDFQGHGQRDHSWGVRDWWTTAWCWNAGWLEDGTRFHSVSPRTLDGDDIPFSAGYVQPPGEALQPIASSLAREEVDENGFPTAGRIEVGDLHLEVAPRYFSPVLLTDPDARVSRFPRCLARFADASGRQGLGWIEWNQPQRS